MEFINRQWGICLHHKKYVEYILTKIKMRNHNHKITPMETSIKLKKDTSDGLVDTTMYRQIMSLLTYSCNTRIDIFLSVGLVSKFLEKYKSCHLLVSNRIPRYIKSTSDHGVLMPN